MKTTITKYLAILFLMTLVSAFALADISGSVVSIRATVQEPNYYSPWQKQNHNVVWLSGTVIAPGLVLTLAHGLKNHVMVELSKLGQQQRYPARVILKDYVTGFALVTTDNPAFFNDLEVARIAKPEVKPGDAVVVKWDGSGIFKSYNAKHFKTGMQSYEMVSASLFFYLTTSMDSGGNGEPVFQDGELLGITAIFDGDKKTMMVNGAPTLHWFLKEIADGTYSGQPFFWIDTSYLRGDENLKSWLGMKDEDTGMLVHSLPPFSSGYGILQEGDVILNIDGQDVDDDGYVKTAVHGRLNFMYQITLSHFVGDKISCEIIRDKKRMTLEFELLPLVPEAYLIAPFYTDDTPLYYIPGGLLFQEMTTSYMKNWGGDWSISADKRFLELYYSSWIYPDDTRRRVVILNRVLPDDLNKGYHERANLILTAVDGQLPVDLADFKRIVEESKEEYVRFQFLGGGILVFNRAELLAKSAEILKKYEIPEIANF